MSCFLFGHAPSGVMAKLVEQMRNPAFECRRCGGMVWWKGMPRVIRAKRDEYLRRVSK